MTERDSLGRPGSTTQYLAERIRAARRTAGMSQSDLAKALHTTQSAISLYEGAQRAVSIILLLKISEVLRCPLEELLADLVTQPRDPDARALLERMEEDPSLIPPLLAYRDFLSYRSVHPPPELPT